MADPGTLDGYGVLVTGGGSGIGLACARRLVADGAAVVVAGRSEERLKAAVAELEEASPGPGRVGLAAADVTDEARVAEAVAVAHQLGQANGGGLRGVIACAGGSETIGPLTLTALDRWNRTLATNLTGTFLAIKHSAPLMAAGGGGSIIGISSIASSNTHRWFGAYGVAKAAIDHLCMLAADELGASGIRVNSIRPGLVETGLVTGLMGNQAVLEDYLACTPLGRIGQPEDIADLARFLIGPESSWVTGQTINADGGHSLRRGPDIRPLVEPIFGPDALRGLETRSSRARVVPPADR
ncbi:MAG TPA: SDR family oxidoreductase [Acidimicrobiales bacterium]|nr:SDR family oxidoreductase [Acidimicrobiales bacterium]